MLRRATCCVERLSGCQLLAQSRWQETVPIGGPAGQGAFLNGALLLECTISATELAGALQAIEAQLGRERAIRWDARAIDIDLLLYGSEVIDSRDLSVPHPRMSCRKFVLEPAAEIGGFMIDPISGWTLCGLLRHLQDSPRYVAVVSSERAVAEWLAERLCQELRCPRLEEIFPGTGGVGDLGGPATVEFNQWADASLRRSRWEDDKELAKRLPSCCGGLQETVSPVVSAAVPTQRGLPLREDILPDASMLRPALVIVVEPAAEEKFWKKIGTKKDKKTPPIFPVPPCSLFFESSNCQGFGPMVRLRAEDLAIVMQEAVAAIRSVWPELLISASDEQ